MECAIIHYHEIALKGKNRPYFINRLVDNIGALTSDLPIIEVKKLWGRLLLTALPKSSWPTIEERLRYVFGIANFSPALKCKPSLKEMIEKLEPEILKYNFNTFRVSARRSYKNYPLTSQEINAQIGAHVVKLTDKKVDLTHPDLNINIEILPEQAFIYFRKVQGAGGLPVGTSGTVVSLLSGGIDSPVAAYRMMRRGCRVVFVHFHSFPFLNKRSQEKAEEIARHLTRYQHRSLLYLVPFGDIQKEVVALVPHPLRVVIYRRLMLRIACEFARKHGAGALVTGESLGQVASQTLANIGVIQQAAEMPVLRPLIGMDKHEISKEAMAIGTYETSVIPDQDCCQLFIPRKPATHSRLEEVLAAEKALNIAGMVQQSTNLAETRSYVFP